MTHYDKASVERSEATGRVNLRPVVLHGNALYRLVQSASRVLAGTTKGLIPRASD